MSDACGLSQYSGRVGVDDVQVATAVLDETVPGSATHYSATSAWKVQVITDYQEFLDLRAVWDGLVAEANLGFPFIGHAWVRAWWDSFGAGKTLNILLISSNGQPVAIVPLMLIRRRLCGIPVRQLQFIWNVYVERCDFVVGRWPQGAYRAALAHLLNDAKDWDLLLLHQLPENSPSIAEMRRLSAELGMRLEMRKSADSPYLPTAGTWETYHAGLDAKHRSNLRNRLKRLKQLGSVSLEVITAPDDVAHALEDGFRLEAAAWKGRVGSAIGCNAQSRHYYTQLAHAAAQGGSLRLCFLTLDGARIAFGYFIEQDNKLYLLKPGYDPNYAVYSPSNLLCDLVLRDAFSRQVSELDFLGFADPWKLQWARLLRSHYWLYLFPNRPKSRFVQWLRFRLQPALGRMPFIRAVCKAALTDMTGMYGRKATSTLCVRGK